MLYGKSQKVLGAIQFLCQHEQKTSTLDIVVYLKNRIHDEDLRGCIHILETEGCVNILEEVEAYILVSLTHKGRHFNEYRQKAFMDFLGKSIFTPIIVAFITTLITLWLQGVFSPK